MKLSSPLHLHKCWSGAYTVILAVVPPRAGECRFVRVTSVLIFARAPACVVFVLARTPGRPGTSARSRVAPRPPLRASRTRHPACRHRRAGPGRTAVPHRNAAHRQTRRRRTTRTLGKDHARTRRDSPLFPVTQNEHEGDVQDEHVEPDIPGVYPAVRAHGGGVLLTVSRRAVLAAASWSW